MALDVRSAQCSAEGTLVIGVAGADELFSRLRAGESYTITREWDGAAFVTVDPCGQVVEIREDGEWGFGGRAGPSTDEPRGVEPADPRSEWGFGGRAGPSTDEPRGVEPADPRSEWGFGGRAGPSTDEPRGVEPADPRSDAAGECTLVLDTPEADLDERAEWYAKLGLVFVDERDTPSGEERAFAAGPLTVWVRTGT